MGRRDNNELGEKDTSTQGGKSKTSSIIEWHLPMKRRCPTTRGRHVLAGMIGGLRSGVDADCEPSQGGRGERLNRGAKALRKALPDGDSEHLAGKTSSNERD